MIRNILPSFCAKVNLGSVMPKAQPGGIRALAGLFTLALLLAACDGPPSDRWLAGSFLRCHEAEDGTRTLIIDGERRDLAEARGLIQRLNEIADDRSNEPLYDRTDYIRASWFIEDCLDIEVKYTVH